MSKPAIVSLGEVLWDLFPEGPRFGGAPANFACHAAAQGAPVSMVSAVGDDARGDEAMEILRSFGIDTSLVQQIAGARTGTVGVKLDASGKPTFVIHEDSAWDQIAWTAALEARVTAAGAVCFGTLGQRGGESRATIRRALGAAKTAGIRRVLDVNLRRPFFDPAMIRESVARASVLKLSDEELQEVAIACGTRHALGDPEASLRALLDGCHLELVAMTRGAEGALLVARDLTIDQPGIPTKVCDTVGAGDAFTAALVTGLLRGDPLATIARVACEIAAAVCAQPGAVPTISRSQ